MNQKSLKKLTTPMWTAGTTYDNGEPDGAVVRSGARFVASCTPGADGKNFTQEECEELAAFLALTPEMLDACQEIEKAISDYAPREFYFEPGVAEVIAKLREVIKKALPDRKSKVPHEQAFRGNQGAF